ncbi:MAG: energy-coupled thiamine transporter ThiT [Lachnospiraceae bacterium]|nr:energy-coupled thiamine transporter ThiT [Lachnospiraceae bacterium]
MSQKTKLIAEGAAMVALATVLSFIRIIKMPWGGSVTLLSMLPIVIFSIKNGVKNGLAVSFVFSLIQFAQGVMDGLFGWGLTPVSLVACILIDYLLAFTVLGLAGLFKKEGLGGWICGCVLAMVLRLFMHFLSGVVIWHSFGELWGGFSTESSVLYSLLYNGAYMVPEIIFTTIGAVILLKAPQTRKIILSEEK